MRMPVRFLERTYSTAKSYTSRPPPSLTSHHPSPSSASSFPKGYIVASTSASIKKNKDRSGSPPLDVGAILSISSRPTSAAASFTINAIRAAPVTTSESVLLKNGGRARAIVFNSGCANAVTGKQGTEDAWNMIKAGDNLLAKHTEVDEAKSHENETLVMSTGVIGVSLPISNVLSSLSPSNPKLTFGSSYEHYLDLAKSLCTTDTFPKLRSTTFYVPSHDTTYTLAGMSKGAGMVHPALIPPGNSNRLSFKLSQHLSFH